MNKTISPFSLLFIVQFLTVNAFCEHPILGEFWIQTLEGDSSIDKRIVVNEILFLKHPPMFDRIGCSQAYRPGASLGMESALTLCGDIQRSRSEEEMLEPKTGASGPAQSLWSVGKISMAYSS